MAPPFVLDVEPAFFDVDIGRAVLAHGAQLDDMAIGRVLHDRPDQVHGRIEIVVEREAGLTVANHGVGRRRLFRIVNHRIRPEIQEDPFQRAVVGHIADFHADLMAAQRVEGCHPIVQIRRGNEGFRLGLLRNCAAQVVVDDIDVMTFGGKVHGRRPAQVAVPAQNQDSHTTHSSMR